MTFKNCKRIEELIDIAFLLFCFDLIVFSFFLFLFLFFFVFLGKMLRYATCDKILTIFKFVKESLPCVIPLGCGYKGVGF